LRQEDCEFETNLGYKAKLNTKRKKCLVAVAHTFNPSYLGVRDWETEVQARKLERLPAQQINWALFYVLMISAV
jgi:hypothetical protein